MLPRSLNREDGIATRRDTDATARTSRGNQLPGQLGLLSLGTGYLQR
jgi:hypothetical protein